MAFAIVTKDKPNSLQVRMDHRADHVAYLDATVDKLLAAGGLIEDDGSGGSGGVILLDVETRAEAEAFVANDPFTKAELFESVTITRWRKAFFDFQKLI